MAAAFVGVFLSRLIGGPDVTTGCAENRNIFLFFSPRTSLLLLLHFLRPERPRRVYINRVIYGLGGTFDRDTRSTAVQRDVLYYDILFRPGPDNDDDDDGRPEIVLEPPPRKRLYAKTTGPKHIDSVYEISLLYRRLSPGVYPAQSNIAIHAARG